MEKLKEVKLSITSPSKAVKTEISRMSNESAHILTTFFSFLFYVKKRQKRNPLKADLWWAGSFQLPQFILNNKEQLDKVAMTPKIEKGQM